MRKAITFVMIACITSLIAGCGVRGPLEPPPGAVSKKGDGLAREKSVEDRPFILDGLLN